MYRYDPGYICYDKNMKYAKQIRFVINISAIFITLAYAIGLFRTYDILQASVMTIVAVLFGLEMFLMSRREIKER
jgi:hypothetical protein